MTLLAFKQDGKSTFKLLDTQGEVVAFSVYANSLSVHPFNTRRTYCHAVADFFDYFYEASFHLAATEEGKAGLTRTQLREVIESWSDYLTLGEKSGKDLVKRVCATLPSPLNSTATASTKTAALQTFLMLSDQLREETAELISLKLVKTRLEVDPQPLLHSIEKVLISQSERRAFVQNSMLAGVIAGGPTLMRTRSRQGKSFQAKFDLSRVFPFDRIIPFIEALPSYRDKALYSLCAASGCRVHEALQILWDDIDFEERTVKFIAPYFRINDASYLALSPEERDKLAWKGRETDVAFMIEPFVSEFFHYLELYMREEHYFHGQQQFVFQHSKGKLRGRPYFLAAQQSRQEIFDAAAAKVGIPPTVDGPHCFRYGYGTYLLNYIPQPDGTYGLPMETVRVMMGHASIKSTQKYAVHDKDLLKMQLAHANAYLLGKDKSKAILQVKLDALRAELEEYERYVLSVTSNAGLQLETHD